MIRQNDGGTPGMFENAVAALAALGLPTITMPYEDRY